MALLVSFPQLTHAVTCLEVLHMDQTKDIWCWNTSPFSREGQCYNLRWCAEAHMIKFCFWLCPGLFLSNPSQIIFLSRSTLSVHPRCRLPAAFQGKQGSRKRVCDDSFRRKSFAEQSAIQAAACALRRWHEWHWGRLHSRQRQTGKQQV